MNVLPCPFCGSNVKVEMPKFSEWHIECPGCHAGMVRRGFDSSIKRERERALSALLSRWNRRAAQKGLQSDVLITCANCGVYHSIYLPCQSSAPLKQTLG